MAPPRGNIVIFDELMTIIGPLKYGDGRTLPAIIQMALAHQGTINLSRRFIVETYLELFSRHFSQRPKVQTSRRRDDRIHLTDPRFYATTPPPKFG